MRLTSMTIVETGRTKDYCHARARDLFIALPGGLGTLEEISEAIAAAPESVSWTNYVSLVSCGYYGTITKH